VDHFSLVKHTVQQIQKEEQSYYLIEDLAHPGFKIELLAHWLSPKPVEASKPLQKPAPLVLSVSALDKLVQMIVRKNEPWRADKNEPATEPAAGSPVAATASGKQAATESCALLHRPQTTRRHTP
jgi:hypothetical protein